jgi:cytochrome c-type biogenesis protein
MVPLVVGFVGGTTTPTRGRAFVLSLGFALGLAITFMLLGVTAALVGGLVEDVSAPGYYLAAFVCFVLGMQMLGALELSLPGGFARLRERTGWRGLPGALALGLVSGLVASQCATPVLLAVLTYVMVQQAAIGYGAGLLFVYALGRGFPIILAGTFAGALKQMQRVGRWSYVLEYGSGLALLCTGFYFLWLA